MTYSRNARVAGYGAALFVTSFGLLDAEKAAAKPSELQPTCSESSVASYSMTYDPDRKLVLIFGGETTSGAASTSTWGWNGRSWQCVAPGNASGPRARDAAMLAYDALRHVLVLYGGRAGREGMRDTWELDASGWHLKDDAGPTPAPHGVLAFDSASGGVLLFNGIDETSTRSTWRWDGTRWTKLADGPHEEFPDAMFTSHGKQPAMLMTARATSVPDAFNAPLYQWHAGQWNKFTTTGDAPVFSPQAPAARTVSGALLYAGFESSGAVTTWVLNGTAWTRYQGESPSRRRNAQMVFDPMRSVVVLHAGYDGARVLTDTWEWNGVRWTKVQ